MGDFDDYWNANDAKAYREAMQHDTSMRVRGSGGGGPVMGGGGCLLIIILVLLSMAIIASVAQ